MLSFSNINKTNSAILRHNIFAKYNFKTGNIS